MSLLHGKFEFILNTQTRESDTEMYVHVMRYYYHQQIVSFSV